MKERIESFIHKIRALDRFSDENAFQLSLIVDEYHPVLQELFDANPNLFVPEMSAFADIYSIKGLLIRSNTLKGKKDAFASIRNGLLTDLQAIAYRIKPK